MTIFEFLKTIFSSRTEASRLENFIVSHNPQSTTDVESLTRQYEQNRTMQWFNNY
jgi:hypothetical protein